MWALAPMAALSIIAGRVDLDGLAVAEVRGGEAPLYAGQDSIFQLVEVVTPTIILRDVEHTGELRLAYGPRLLWRQSADLRSPRPLVLHLATLDGKIRLSPRASLGGGVNATAGAADYAYLQQVGAPNQTTLPQVINFVSVTAAARTEVKISPTLTFSGMLQVLHHRPLGDSGATQTANNVTVPILYPHQTMIQVQPTLTSRVSPLDDVAFILDANYQSLFVPPSQAAPDQPLTGEALSLTVSPELAWRTRLTPRHELRLAVGVSYNQVLKSQSLLRPVPFAPIGGADLTVNLLRRNELALRAIFEVLVDYFVNPVIGAAGSRGTASASVFLEFPPNWTVGISGTFATSLSPKPLGGQYEGQFRPAPGVPYPDETVATVSLPVRCRASPNLLLEVGGRFSDRAPHLAAPGFEFHQTQLWLYFMVTALSAPAPRGPAQ